MSVVGMFTSHAGQSHYGITVDTDQPSRGADAAALLEVPKDGMGLLFGKMAVKERRPFAFGEAVSASIAVEEANVVLFAVAGTDREVADTTLAGERTVGVLASEARKIIPGKT